VEKTPLLAIPVVLAPALPGFPLFVPRIIVDKVVVLLIIIILR
jgi:hypothetical protein